MKRLECLLLALMITFSMTACDREKAGSDEEKKPSGVDSPTSNISQTTDNINTAPKISEDNLREYLPDLGLSYAYSVGDSVVENNQAIYTVELTHSGRFASMTGLYKLVLIWDGSTAHWTVDTNSCQWIERNYWLNEDELFGNEYYWAAYPLTPVKSDPIYFVLTNISDDECTIEWWSPDFANSKINNAYDGKMTTSVCVKEDGVDMPRWVFENIEISSVKNSSNPISFTLELTPNDFMIVPSDESAKYVGAFEINLSRIINEQYYSRLVVDALKDDAHREMIELGAEKLWHHPELVWGTSSAVDSYVGIESIGYAGSLYFTGDGSRNSSLYIIYGMEISLDCPGTYCPRYGVMYYAVEFTDLKVDNGVLTYNDIDIDPFNDSASMPLPWIEGGYTEMYMYGSTSLTAALEYYQSVFGKVYSLEYINPTAEDSEYLDYLKRISEGKIGFILDDSLKVVAVTAGGAAETAGIKVGDVLVAIYECPLGNRNSSTIANILKGTAETEVELTVLRNGSEYTFTVVRQAAE